MKGCVSNRLLIHKRARICYIIPCFLMFSVFAALVMNNGLFQVKKDTSFNTRRDNSRKILQEPLECIPPSIDDFPGDFFTQEERQRGGVVIHFLITAYLCGMLAIVCDEYFVPSLEIISEFFNVPSDVAGATFMAIGTSSPELFSSIIGAFITEGDIGIGTIVGSAVFNILGVTSLTGLAVWTTDVPIDWFPITRDCLIYGLTVGALMAVIYNNEVIWWEALILVVMFALYILMMYFNSRIENVCTRKVQKMMVKWKSRKKSEEEQERTSLLSGQVFCPEIKDTEKKFIEEDSFMDQSHDIDTFFEQRSRRESQIIMDDVKSMEEDEEERDSVWSMPHHGAAKQIWWVLMWPASLFFYITIPDCRKSAWKKFFPLTFLSSVVWLGVLSYMAVWMVTIIGYTLGIPDTVSGLTILAAGTSIPEMISSIIVVRNGLGNMAICNLLGSNIFDILFCLGAPWLVKSLAFSEDKTVIINSSALTYTTATLLSTVFLIFIVFISFGWKLNWKVGVTCLILYLGFLILACMYELNFFGEFNPPPCPR